MESGLVDSIESWTDRKHAKLSHFTVKWLAQSNVFSPGTLGLFNLQIKIEISGLDYSSYGYSEILN